MSKRKKHKKISTSQKISIGAISILGVIGGWNVIGRMEASSASEEFAVQEVTTPTPAAIQPTPPPWPTIQPVAEIPRLELRPLPTLAAISLGEGQQDSSLQAANGAVEAYDISDMPSAQPMPTLAPLPTLPEYVPPPPPPPPQVAANPSSSGGNGGGNKSKGS